MRRCRSIRPGLPVMLLVLVLPALPSVAAPDPEVVSIRDGAPLEVAMPAGAASWNARIDLPQDAVSLSVVASGDRDVDLYVRHGRPVGEDPDATSDVSATGDSPHEVVILRSGDRVGPRAGTWFVTVVRPGETDTATAFEVAAFVDRRRGRETLLPGQPVGVRIPEPGKAFAMRTWLPRRVVTAAVNLSPSVLEGLRYRLEGPGGFRRRETAVERIELGGGDVPRGVYTLILSTPAPSVQPRPLQASVTWSLPGGRVLPRPSSPLLEANRPIPVLMGGPKNGSVQPFTIRVGRGTGGFLLTAKSAAGANVDLYVRRGTPPLKRDEDAEWAGLSVGPAERLAVAGEETLPPGEYHAEVLLVDDEKPVEVIVTLRAIDLETGPRTWGATAPASLAPDTWTEGVVQVFESAISWHGVEVPAGAESLHAQILDASGPLELVLVRSQDGGILARSFTPLVDEHLEVVFPAALPEAQRFVLGVLNRATWDEKVTFRIAWAIDRRPDLPENLPWPPAMLLEALTPAERTAAATVEITIGDCSGGSGVCVSPDGLVLSCRHCLKLKRGIGGVQHEGILVAFPATLEEPPIQAFYAKLLDEDPDRDLVLLEPLRDVFDRPMPEDIELPWLPLGDSAKLRLGETVWVAGYPQVGSECTRTAVILSKGIVAGLERRNDGPSWIKTDAWVAPGHSGGPLVDAEGRLVGIAAATLGTTESLGLAIPVGRLPDAWRDRIRGRAKPAQDD